MKISQIVLTILPALIFFSCVKDSLDDTVDQPNGEIEEGITAMEDLTIPQGFEFQTEQEINLTINDTANGTRYVVLVGGNQVLNRLVVQESISSSFNISMTIGELTLLRRTAHSLEEINVPVTGNTVSFNYSN